MNGGYFLGSTTVVAGISGVGKSVMACQFLAEGVRLGERSLMLSLDEQVPQIIGVSRAFPGYAIGEYYLLKTDGIFQTQAEVDAYCARTRKKQRSGVRP